MFCCAALEARTRSPTRKKTLWQSGTKARGPRTTWTEQDQDTLGQHEETYTDYSTEYYVQQNEEAEIPVLEDSVRHLQEEWCRRSGPRSQRPSTGVDSAIEAELELDQNQESHWAWRDSDPYWVRQVRQQEQPRQEVDLQRTKETQDRMRNGPEVKGFEGPRPTWTLTKTQQQTATEDRMNCSEGRLKETHVEEQQSSQVQRSKSVLDPTPAASLSAPEWEMARKHSEQLAPARTQSERESQGNRQGNHDSLPKSYLQKIPQRDESRGQQPASEVECHPETTAQETVFLQADPDLYRPDRQQMGQQQEEGLRESAEAEAVVERRHPRRSWTTLQGKLEARENPSPKWTRANKVPTDGVRLGRDDEVLGQQDYEHLETPHHGQAHGPCRPWTEGANEVDCVDGLPPAELAIQEDRPKHHMDGGSAGSPLQGSAQSVRWADCYDPPNADTEQGQKLIPNWPEVHNTHGSHQSELILDDEDGEGHIVHGDVEDVPQTRDNGPKHESCELSTQHTVDQPNMVDRPYPGWAREHRLVGANHTTAPMEPSCVESNNPLKKKGNHGHLGTNAPAWDSVAIRSGNPRGSRSPRWRPTNPCIVPAASDVDLGSHPDGWAGLATDDPQGGDPREDCLGEGQVQVLRGASEDQLEVGQPLLPLALGSEPRGVQKTPAEYTADVRSNRVSQHKDLSKSTNYVDIPPLWWREVCPSEPRVLLSTAEVHTVLAGLKLTIDGKDVLALLDTGATNSFVSPRLVDELQLQPQATRESIRLVVASGQGLDVQEEISQLNFRVGSMCTSARFLVAPVPYPVILGADWLQSLRAVWDFGSGLLRVQKKNYHFELRLIQLTTTDLMDRLTAPQVDEERRQARGAHAQLVESVTRLGPQAASLVRKQPKRYKNFKTKFKRVPIKELIELAKKNGEDPLADPTICLMLVADPEGQGPTRSDMGFSGTRRDLDFPDPLETQGSVSNHQKVDEWLREAEANRTNSELVSLIREYRDLFVDELPDGLPPPRVLDMTIVTVPDATVPKGGTPRFTQPEVEVIRNTLQQYLRKRWIQRSVSPYASPVLLVPKKGDPPGSPGSRMVINYRPLNAVTIAAEVPLPVIEDVLASLQGAKWFTTMDMEQGFHQVRMAPEDRHKTAFRTFMGQFEWCVMPFGLKGAPSTFQAIMNEMFFDLLGNGVLVYMDDVLIYSDTFDKHLKLLKQVLQRLLDNKMFPKFSKCRFGVQSIEYLGYLIAADGIRPSPDKVKAISIWPTTLENDTQVRQFLGTVNYCRNFMGPEFAVLARPLQQLIRHGAKFEWTDEHTTAVKALKDRLINYTLLALPDPKKPYVVRTDASGFAIGAVLEQDDKPLGFMSKRLTEVEARYPTYDQELLAIIRALERWRYLLLTAKTTVYTDHQALQYLTKLQTDRPLRGRIARWLEKISAFSDVQIVYQPGATNVVADALSRCPVHQSEPSRTSTKASSAVATVATNDVGETSSTNSDSPPVPNSDKPVSTTLFVLSAHTAPRPIRIRHAAAGSNSHLDPDPGHKPTAKSAMDFNPNSQPEMQGIGDEAWEAALQRCSEFGTAYKVAKANAPNPIFVEDHGRFKMEDRILCIQLQGLWRICVPNFPRFRQRLLYLHHDLPTSGHLGITKTYNQLALRFYWKGIREYTKTYVETCPRCRASKSLSQKPGGLLQPLSIPSRRWANISLDFIVGLPMSQEGFDSILTVVDSLSKMAHFVPTRSTLSTSDFVQLFSDRVVRYHGLPQTIVSDRDTRFVSEFWRVFCQRFGIKRALSSAWHPQTDGQTERANRAIEQMLRTFIQSREENWTSLLPALELAYNCSPHSATGLSPFEVMIGENPIRPQDLDLVDRFPPTTTPPMTKAFRALVDRAAAHLEQAKIQQKAFADASRRPLEFSVGDHVWVSTRYMVQRGSRVFAQRYVGPFRIIERIGKAAYKLDLPPSMQVHPVFHVSLLTADKPRPQEMQGDNDWQPMDEVEHGLPTYEVEHILDQRGEGPTLQYLVKWKGFPASDATWEPASHLDNCPALLRAFRKTRNRVARRRAPPIPVVDNPNPPTQDIPTQSNSLGQREAEGPGTICTRSRSARNR